MKKIYLIIAAGAIIASCQQSVEPQKQVEFIEISSLSEESQLFVPLADIAFNYGTDNESREFLYKEIDKQFDGDNNVLFSTMLKSKNAINGRGTKSKAMLKTEAALESFKQIKNVAPLYPQIFIPFYEELKGAGKLGSEQPIIVLNDGPPSSDGSYQGYAFENGNLVDKGMVTEEFASYNEVWVISINERVNEMGIVPEGNIISNGKQATFDSPRIEGLTIFGKGCMKEAWVSGAADVAWTPRVLFNSYDTDANAYEPFGYDNHGNVIRDRITDVSRKSARKHTYQNLASDNHYFVKGWATDPRYNTYFEALYTMFEYDAWPAGKGYAVVGSYTMWPMEYRSYEGPFLSERVERGQMGNYRISNSCFSLIIN